MIRHYIGKHNFFHGDWCWLKLIDLLIDADWCCLMQIDADWCSNKAQLFVWAYFQSFSGYFVLHACVPHSISSHIILNITFAAIFSKWHFFFSSKFSRGGNWSRKSRTLILRRSHHCSHSTRGLQLCQHRKMAQILDKQPLDKGNRFLFFLKTIFLNKYRNVSRMKVSDKTSFLLHFLPPALSSVF